MLNYINRENISWFAMLLIAIGLPLSPALMSIGQALLMITWLIDRNLGQKLMLGLKDKSVQAFLLLFVLHLVGLIHTTNFEYAFKDIKIKLPLLLIPLSLAVLPSLSERKFNNLLLVSLIACLIASFYSMSIYFGIDFSKQDTLRSISPIISHIRFSLICCMAVFICLYFFVKQYLPKFRFIWIVLAIWFFLFIGILGARAGYLSIVVGLGAISSLYLWKQRKFKYLIAGLVLLVSIPYLMYQFVPSVNKRVDEAFWEVRMYKQGENPSGHSISQRFVYWSIAKHIFSENLLLGVGTGDIDDAFKNYYATHQTPLSKEWQFRAHNQYFTILCTFGVLGFFIFIFAFVYPFVVNFNARNYLGIALMIIVMLSMLTEDTLETQAGATFIAFYFSLFILRRPPLDKLA